MAGALEFVDTHCHIHFPDYELEEDVVIAQAIEAGVTRMMCVGCTLEDSKLAVTMAARNKRVWASIGLHPHEAKHYVNNEHALQEFHALASKSRVVAVGEIGLDYYYGHSDASDQKALLRYQLTVAQEHNLPVIFHVRDHKGMTIADKSSVWHDFWAIYDEFKLPGVIHSFSAGTKELAAILERNLYVGLNGIMTFTKDEQQLAAAKAVPLQKMVMETDAPFLTPKPYRGTMCEPKHVAITAAFLSELRGEHLEDLARATTQNARRLFNLV